MSTSFFGLGVLVSCVTRWQLLALKLLFVLVSVATGVLGHNSLFRG
jgi:hypothetical protein